MFVYEVARHRDWYCKLIARLIAKIIQHLCKDPYIHYKVFYLECCNEEDGKHVLKCIKVKMC